MMIYNLSLLMHKQMHHRAIHVQTDLARRLPRTYQAVMGCCSQLSSD